MRKMTFTLDEGTALYLGRAAERPGMPKSQVVREAVQMYGEQLGRLSDEERDEKLRIFDEMMSQLPSRARGDIDAELAAVRSARRGGGRREGGRRQGGRPGS